MDRERQNLVMIGLDVKKARRYLPERFPSPGSGGCDSDSVFGKRCYKVVFTDVDKATVVPLAFGREMTSAIAELRIAWRDGMLLWVGNFAVRKKLLGAGDELEYYVGLAEGRP